MSTGHGSSSLSHGGETAASGGLCKIPPGLRPSTALASAPAWTIEELTGRLRPTGSAAASAPGSDPALVGLCAIVAAALAGRLGDVATVGRAVAVYAFLLAVFRVSGRRTLAQVTTFDLILVLILGDATQEALIGEATFATAIVAIATLVLVDVGLARAKRRWPAVDVLVDGLPLPLVVHGRPQEAAMDSEGVTNDDVLTAAREGQGLARLQEVRFAVLEQNGRISVVPRARWRPSAQLGLLTGAGQIHASVRSALHDCGTALPSSGRERRLVPCTVGAGGCIPGEADMTIVLRQLVVGGGLALVAIVSLGANPLPPAVRRSRRPCGRKRTATPSS